MAFLGYHIIGVISVRADKKMVRIDAGAVIAVVADQFAFGDFATMSEFPRQTMRDYLDPGVADTEIKKSVPIPCFAPLPFPTGSAADVAINIAAKAVLKNLAYHDTSVDSMFCLSSVAYE